MSKQMLSLSLLGTALLILSGCASNSDMLPATPQLPVLIAAQNSFYIRQAEFYEDEKGQFIRGRVGAGNRSHISRPYSGHIDIFVTISGGEPAFNGIVPLGGRQQYFRYRLRTPVDESARIILEYSKASHGQHAMQSSNSEAEVQPHVV